MNACHAVIFLFAEFRVLNLKENVKRLNILQNINFIHNEIYRSYAETRSSPEYCAAAIPAFLYFL